MAAVTAIWSTRRARFVIGEGAVSMGPPRVPDGAPFVLINERPSRTDPGCKETLAVEPESAAHRIAHAVRLAMTEPRGAVHLDIPARVLEAAALPVRRPARPDPPRIRTPAPSTPPRARYPMPRDRFCSPGFTAARTMRPTWLRALVEALPAPLLATAGAKGALPDPQPG
jgi:acetolactate synthase-1/2/3 large subunit